jgi:hypothetical protein
MNSNFEFLLENLLIFYRNVKFLISKIVKLIENLGVHAGATQVILKFWDLVHSFCFLKVKDTFRVDLFYDETWKFFAHSCTLHFLKFLDEFLMRCGEPKLFRKVFSRISMTLPKTPIIVENSASEMNDNLKQVLAYFGLILIFARYSPMSDSESLYHCFDQIYDMANSSTLSRLNCMQALFELAKVLSQRKIPLHATAAFINSKIRTFFSSNAFKVAGLHESVAEEQQMILLNHVKSTCDVFVNASEWVESINMISCFLEVKQDFTDPVREESINLIKLCTNQSICQFEASKRIPSLIIAVKKVSSEILSLINIRFMRSDKNTEKDPVAFAGIELLAICFAFLIFQREKDLKDIIYLFGLKSKWSSGSFGMRIIPLQFYAYFLQTIRNFNFKVELSSEFLSSMINFALAHCFEPHFDASLVFDLVNAFKACNDCSKAYISKLDLTDSDYMDRYGIFKKIYRLHLDIVTSQSPSSGLNEFYHFLKGYVLNRAKDIDTAQITCIRNIYLLLSHILSNLTPLFLRKEFQTENILISFCRAFFISNPCSNCIDDKSLSAISVEFLPFVLSSCFSQLWWASAQMTGIIKELTEKYFISNNLNIPVEKHIDLLVSCFINQERNILNFQHFDKFLNVYCVLHCRAMNLKSSLIRNLFRLLTKIVVYLHEKSLWYANCSVYQFI